MVIIRFLFQVADSEETIRSLEMELAMSQEKHRTCTQEVQHAQQCFISTRHIHVRIKLECNVVRNKVFGNLNLNLICKMFAVCNRLQMPGGRMLPIKFE